MFRTVLKYDGKVIVEGGSGTDYAEFLEQLEGKQKASQKALIYLFFLFADGERVYGYVRFETGDEMSRRAKFAFITWIGPSVGALKKAKVSTDKAFVKAVWTVGPVSFL